MYLGEFGVDNYAPPASRKRWYWWVRNQAERSGYSLAFWNMYNNSPGSKGLGPWTSEEKADPGKRYLDPFIVDALTGKYEAEEASLSGNLMVLNESEPAVSGQYVQTGDTATIVFNRVYAGKSDSVNLYIRYRNTNPAPQSLLLSSKIPSDTSFLYVKNMVFMATDPDGWGYLNAKIFLQASDSNEIRFESNKNGSIDLDFIAFTRGLYYEYLYPTDWCSDCQVIDTVLADTTGIDTITNETPFFHPIDFNEGLKIFPNPVTLNTVHILFSDREFSGEGIIVLSGITGGIITSWQANSARMSINLPDQLEGGCYILQYWDAVSGRRYTKQLIILK